MSTSSRSSAPVKPVTGTVRWIMRPGGPTLWGRFSITVETTRGVVTNEYDVAAIKDGDRIIGFGLARDDDEVYCLDFSQWFGPTCTCGDYEFRQRECKHIRAVRAAMHEAGIVIPAPKPDPAPEPSICTFEDP